MNFDSSFFNYVKFTALGQSKIKFSIFYSIFYKLLDI